MFEEYEQCLTRFESMIKTNRVFFFDALEFEAIVQHYIDSGKIALAKKALKLGLEQHPNVMCLSLLKVEIIIFEDQLDQAEELLNVLERIEPSNEEVYIHRASLYSKKENHLTAIEMYLKVLDLTDDPGEILAFIGMEYLFLEDYNNAKSFFIDCLKEDPTDYSALYNLIYCFDYLTQHDEAILYLNGYLENNPYSEVAWQQLGKQYYAIKAYEKALSAYDFATISDDSFVGAYLEKGKVLERLKRYNEAIENYQLTLVLDDPTAYALLRIGHCYELLGATEMALQFYRKTIKEDPILEKGWLALANFFYRQNELDEAISTINKALNVDQENIEFWKVFAKIQKKLKHFEQVEEAYKQMIELGLCDLDIWLERSDNLIKMNQSDLALVNLKQAAVFHIDEAEVYFRIAGILIEQLKTEEGLTYLKRAYEQNADYDFILEDLFPSVLLKPSIISFIETFKSA